jgi:hypothetical protein
VGIALIRVASPVGRCPVDVVRLICRFDIALIGRTFRNATGAYATALRPRQAKTTRVASQPTFDPQCAFHLCGRVADVRSLPGNRRDQYQLRCIVLYRPALPPWAQMSDESGSVGSIVRVSSRLKSGLRVLAIHRAQHYPGAIVVNVAFFFGRIRISAQFSISLFNSGCKLALKAKVSAC